MKLVFYLLSTLCFIIFQTVMLPGTVWFELCFDLQIINILYLSLHVPHYSLAFSILVIGFIMDSLSGTPFFYYTFSYLWIWALVQAMRRFVFSRSILFLLAISLVSVLIQHLLFVFSVLIRQGTAGIGLLDYELMFKQMIMGVVLIPPGLGIMNILYSIWAAQARQFRKKIETIMSE